MNDFNSLSWSSLNEDVFCVSHTSLSLSLNDVVEEGHDVGSSDESSGWSKFHPLGIEFTGTNVGFNVVKGKLVDVSIELKDALGNSSGLGFVKSILTGKGIF